MYVGDGAKIVHTGNYACALPPLTSTGAWGAANTAIQNGRLGFVPTFSPLIGGEGSAVMNGMTGPAAASLETTPAASAERMANARRSTLLTHLLWANSGTFTGVPFNISTGTGHRVSIRDGREPGRREQAERTGPAGLAGNAAEFSTPTALTMPVVYLTGTATVSPFNYGNPTNTVVAVTRSNVTIDEYSFSHIINTDIDTVSGTPFNDGIRIGSRCDWAGSGNKYNTVMRVPVGVTAYQWWAHDKLGVLTRDGGSRGSDSGASRTLVKAPILIDNASNPTVPQGISVKSNGYSKLLNTSDDPLTLMEKEHKFCSVLPADPTKTPYN
jgi:hypothetical protein